MRHKIQLTLLIVALCLPLFASDTTAIKEKRFENYQKFDASYIVGAQVYNDNFLYNPGYNMQLSYGSVLSKDLLVGVGVGYTELQKERFIPLYMEAIGFKSKKRNAPFIKFQGGYSIGWMEPGEHQQGHEMRGGLYFNAGVGRKIAITDNVAMLFHISYSHQFGSMEYEVFGGEDYTTELNYEMVWFTIGLLTL